MLKRLLRNHHVILASQSPRRKKILIENGGLEYEKDFFVMHSEFDEKSLDKKSFPTPKDFVIENSRLKALQVFNACKNSKENLIVIGSDSVVVYEEHILEKPVNEMDAVNMLQMLSGNTHRVLSGVSIYIKTGDEEQLVTFAAETTVLFDTLTLDHIKEYIETGEPFDKAGAYGIQDLGAAFVKSIEGDYHTVMGLPYHLLYTNLRRVLSNDNNKY
ncbi:hypothetical protein FDP41_006602 [Naegleria fowleri]|uniref:Uncharacterized protein n=1 Tax=Naegleria fowleri TaxID=5763 RepID=A0A6A5BKP0_NAEFO|nr:uncharacterized protein FDP41_006602 [Naegleria fowleri]KAF0974570.1 hypothetical protein FDP41_006602 [Naegleria fowleri]CAG4715980.1 unnamed protein product [Naegleria fowleri]